MSKAGSREACVFCTGLPWVAVLLTLSLVVPTLNAFHCLRLVSLLPFMTHSISGPFTKDSSVISPSCLEMTVVENCSSSWWALLEVKWSVCDLRPWPTFDSAPDPLELPTLSERLGLKNHLVTSTAACSWPCVLLPPSRSTEPLLCVGFCTARPIIYTSAADVPF